MCVCIYVCLYVSGNPKSVCCRRCTSPSSESHIGIGVPPNRYICVYIYTYMYM